MRIFPFRGQVLSLTRITQPCAKLLISTLEWWAEGFLESIIGSFHKGWGTSHDNISRSQKGSFIFCRGSDGWGRWKKLFIWAIVKLWYRTWITQQTQWVHNSHVQTDHLHRWNINFGFFLLARAASHWGPLSSAEAVRCSTQPLQTNPKGKKRKTCHSLLAHGKICELPHYN